MRQHRHVAGPALLVAVACSTLTFATAIAGRAPAGQPAPGRVVAIGDIHGAAEELGRILQAAELVGPDGKWVGGATTFVQTGDYLDRGGAVRQVLDLLMALESQARSAGGRAEVLLGNHEVMNILHEMVDVSPEAFASFADAKSEERRRKAYEAHREIARRARDLDPGPRDAWMAQHPAGYVEYLEAMSARGRYGRWLRARKALAQVNGTAFMHAGLAPGGRGGVDDVNREIARAIRAWDDATDVMVRERLITSSFTLKETASAAATELRGIAAAIEAGGPVDPKVTREYIDHLRGVIALGESPLLAAAGPMWFRGLSAPNSEQTDEQVTALLERLGVTRMVVGHTPRLPGRITPRFNGRVFPIDTGMLTSYFKTGRGSALEIVGNRVTAIYVGEREVLVER
jgi:hypothetical protein